jgi:DNA-binding SARP family transcriptional activator
LARVYLTGGIRMDGPAGTFVDTDLPGNQGRIAFVALAVERRPLSHDELADIVWGEDPPERWKGSLAAVVSKIRTLITATGLDGRTAMLSSGGAYTLVLPAESWVDLEDAHRRLDRGEGALRHGDASAATGDATVAASILRRPLLAGAESRWVERIQARHVDALYRSLTTLAAAWSRLGDHQLAVTVAESAVQLDPLRETGHRLLIESERARGDRGAALRAFTRCERLFANELGVGPSPETVALVEGLGASPSTT